MLHYAPSVFDTLLSNLPVQIRPTLTVNDGNAQIGFGVTGIYVIIRKLTCSTRRRNVINSISKVLVVIRVYSRYVG